MNSISLADAKTQLGALVDRAAAGETVAITRRGKEVARLVGSKKILKPIDVEMLRALAEKLPRETEDAGTFMRKMRDDARY